MSATLVSIAPPPPPPAEDAGSTGGGAMPALGAIPGVGEHTDEILAELGYTAAEVTALRTAGTV